MKRRAFLEMSAMTVAAVAAKPLHAAATPPPIKFPDNDPKWQAAWTQALQVLSGNVKLVPRYDKPVLVEGAVYPGAWMECAPLEGLVYAQLAKYVPHVDGVAGPLEAARANHMAFFALQREDGQIPSAVKMAEVGFGQIQMVVPIAATAWELSQLTHDEELLTTAYASCSKWDAWLRRYRDTRGTGLTEGFCTYDTGHDNSPRWKGVPNRCPDSDARKFPAGLGVPRLCPDLSATTYGARVALAAMARALGKKAEADKWLQDAETIRHLILTRLYSPEDAAFYDVDTDNKFVRVRSDAISRVLGEHVLKLDDVHDRKIFNDVWTRQIHNPKAFWAPYPLTSIAMDDPAFVRPIPRNSWGGASQALTALRVPRWMEYYGKAAEMRVLMRAWVDAIARTCAEEPLGGFRQQMDPLTGEFTKADRAGYSPAALVYLDFVRRLAKAS